MSESQKFVRLPVRTSHGKTRKAVFATRDIARLMAWGDETLLVLRRTAVALDGSEEGRQTYVVPARIERVAARVQGLPAKTPARLDKASYEAGYVKGSEESGYTEGYDLGFKDGRSEGYRRAGGAR